MAVNESSSVGFTKKIVTVTVPAQSITKELIVNFISILGFDEQRFWFQQGGGMHVANLKQQMFLTFFVYLIIFQNE
jgi:hypothetical protein